MDYLSPEQQKRRVVPNWRFFSETKALGELESVRKEKGKFSLFAIDDYVDAWLNRKSFSTAGDLISAAITNGQRQNRYAVEAAKYVEEESPEDYPVLVKSADYILNENTDDILKTPNQQDESIKRLENAQNMSDRIHDIRKQLMVYPYNAVLYADMSRAQLSIGKVDKAIKLMQIALQLDPDNRFVVRAAVRLYHHLGDFDRANAALRHTSLIKYDPWLIAADVTTGMLRGRNSVHIKTGINMIESKNYHPFSCTELASSLGTLEYYFGTRKKSRVFFNSSMVSPNDNSLAQAEWVATKINFHLERTQDVKLDYEARFYQSLSDGDLDNSVKELVSWIIDMPYSQKPIYLGSHLSLSYLGNFELAESILKVGLRVNSENQDFINNMAYALARQGKTKEAQVYMDKLMSIDSAEMTESMKVCREATQGLIAYRNGNKEKGQRHYDKAIALASEIKDDSPEVYYKAVINAKREALIASNYEDTNILEELDRLDVPDSIPELNTLRQEVVDLFKSHHPLVVN